MNTTFVRTGLFSILWVLALTCGLYVLNIGKISPISGTQFFQTGQLCETEDCVTQGEIELPYFVKPRAETTILSQQLNFNFNHSQNGDKIADDRKIQSFKRFGFLFPKIHDDFALEINGKPLRQVEAPERHWNHPFLITVPPSLLNEGTNHLRITLFGPAQEGADLQPFHFGPITILEPAYNSRWLTTVGIGNFNLGLMAVLFLTLGFVWLGRRQDRSYLWLSLSCASACLFLFHYSADTSFMNYKFWTATWGMSVSLYVLFIMKFLNRFLGFDALQLEKIFIGFLILAVATMALMPANHTYMLLLIVNYGTEFFALCVLIILWMNRKRVSSLDFKVFYTCLSVSAALGLYGLTLLTFDEPIRNQQIFQFMPIVMATLCLWLIMSQLMRNLRGYEQLNASLQETIVQKNRRTCRKL